MDIEHPKYDSSFAESAAGANNRTNTNNVSKKDTSAPTNKPANNAANNKPESENKDSFWLLYLIGIVIVAILAFFGVRAASALFDAWTDLSPQKLEEAESLDNSAVSEEAIGTDTSNTEEGTTPAIKLAEEETAPAAETIDKSALKVKVLNGSGVSGAAQSGKAAVEAAGFTVDSVGNAKTFNYDSTIVYYTAGNNEKAQLVADGIADKYETTIEENNAADGFDALVVIGKK